MKMNLSPVVLTLSVLLAVLLSACAGARYTHLERGVEKTSKEFSTMLQANKIGRSESGFKIPRAKFESPERFEFPIIFAPLSNTKERIVSEEPFDRTMTSIAPFSFQPPDDSIEIDLEEETRKAEKLGHTGFVLSMIAVGSNLLLGIGPLIALVGLVYSVVAYYKMTQYELQLKNRKQVMVGLIVNLILVCTLILAVALLLFFFL